MAHELAFGYGKIIENDSVDTASSIWNALEMYADRHYFGVRDIDTSINGIYANSYCG